MNEKITRWLYCAGIRAIKTFAQAVAGGITIGAALNEIDWKYICSVAAVSMIYSLITSLAGLPELETEPTKGE